RPSGVALGVAPGIGGGIRTFRQPDGTGGREYLDVGENPPNGAIVYYWLTEGASGPVSLAFYDEGGTAVASVPSDHTSLAAGRRGSSGAAPRAPRGRAPLLSRGGQPFLSGFETPRDGNRSIRPPRGGKKTLGRTPPIHPPDRLWCRADTG